MQPVAASRYITIHGHFYQPPRENPWLETVEIQDSAYPFHDWNARITAECYGPNTAARRTDAQGRIIDIIDNFAQISFNVGPTLLSWLAGERPDVYARIIEADRRSVRAWGHGNAIAQPYAHPILPLCTRADKITQVRWGLADFRHRFGREAEGMWLPETGVDSETLEVLAEHGIAFTILGPKQAARVRTLPDGEWREVGEAIDPSRAYLWRSGRGHRLALFFYDGPISHAVAFEGLLGSGDAFATRLLGGFDDGRPGAQLVHVATDGESYGHHHPFGEMALAAACQRIREDGRATLTNYGAFLAAHPPTEEVQIVEPSSWSCAHGVERWRADCGCRVGHGGSHQRWRAPLRGALDWLRDEVDPFFEARAGALLKDAWEARNDYLSVVLERSVPAIAAFLGRHQLRPLSPSEQVEALKLLELQRQRLLMYTSCGWFFDDISGIESVQILRYAARVVQLAGQLGGGDLEDGLLARLSMAPSNLPEPVAGDAVYRRHVLPAVVDLRRVVAHYAIAAPFQGYGDGDEARVYAYTVARLDWHREAYGETSLAVGRVRVTSNVTRDSDEAGVAVLHFGGHDFHCALRGLPDAKTFARVRDELLRGFGEHGLAEVVRALDRHFEGKAYGIRDLFLEERRKILGAVTESVLLEIETTYRRLYEERRRLMQYMRDSDVPPPDALALAARYVLQRDLERDLPGLAEADRIPDRVHELMAEARSLGIDLALPRERVAGHLERAFLARLSRLCEELTSVGIEAALAVLRVARELGCVPELWAAQNRFFEIWQGQPPDGRRLLAPLGAALGFGLEVDG
jgi:alpha-amylase/alpha-mannosidase (GH57 family)